MHDLTLIDTHCHLDAPEFDADRQQVLRTARAVGVWTLIVPGVLAAGWSGLLALCASDANLYPALGLHPLFVDRHADADLAALEARLAVCRPLAIGEIGLDVAVPQAAAFWHRQEVLLARQLAMARAADLPVLLHVRKAHDRMLAILRRERVRGGIVHAFNGSQAQALAYRDLGFRLGFGGMLTFARSTRLRRLARDLPLDAIVLETDAPDLTVASHRYARNSPEYLPEILAALAEARALEPIEVARATTRNACELFGLRPPANPDGARDGC